MDTPIYLHLKFAILQFENQVWWTGFLVYFKLEFFMLQQAEESSSNQKKIQFIKLDFQTRELQTSSADI